MMTMPRSDGRSAAELHAGVPTPEQRDGSRLENSVDRRAAAALGLRDLLAAYALLHGRKVALPQLAALRAAFPGAFRSRSGWNGYETWEPCDEACLEAIRAVLRARGRLHLIADDDDAPRARPGARPRAAEPR